MNRNFENDDWIRWALWLSSPVLVGIASFAAVHGYIWFALVPFSVAIYTFIGCVSSFMTIRMFKKLAESGDVEAMLKLGARYREGRQVALSRNDREAVHWFRKAAEQGDARGQFFIGDAYDKGRGVPQDKTEAVRWYRMAAEKGDVDAQFTMGIMYHLGEGVVNDKVEALHWFRMAAERGYMSAQTLLGQIYASGDGTVVDYTEAVRWYSAAFRASTLNSKVAEEYAKQLQWFLSAADMGDDNVLLNVGNIYSSSPGGVTRDYAEALRWYRMAAEKGNDNAMGIIGHMYNTGQGVPKDQTEAMRWYCMAALKGNAAAMFNIAMMYNRGECIAHDTEELKEELYFWYSLSLEGPLPKENADGARKACEILLTKIAPDKLSQIQERIRKWVETHPVIHLQDYPGSTSN
jgi:TPR repeat protein